MLMGLLLVEVVLSSRLVPLFFDPNLHGTEMWDERDGCPLYKATGILSRSRAYMCRTDMMERIGRGTLLSDRERTEG